MRQSPLPPAFESRSHASYQVRLRGTMYLWGSAGMTQNVSFDKAPVLHMRNNLFGEVLTVGTQVGSGAQHVLGSLQPGECLSIQLQNISGVFAECESETAVDCLIRD